MKPRMFIGSSADHLDLAYAAQENLERDVEPTVWTQDVFKISRSAMASFIDILDESDFGLFILSPSDIAQMREEKVHTVRDNVIFELGLFAGRLGIERCFLITPRGVPALHLPSDLLGLTPAEFDPDRQDKNMTAALGPACNRVRKAVEKLGPFIPTTGEPATSAGDPTAPNLQDDSLVPDENDCISLIQSWLGSRSSSANTHAIRYKDVDRELGLSPGSAEKYIERAAWRWEYVAERKGKDTILLKDYDR